MTWGIALGAGGQEWLGRPLTVTNTCRGASHSQGSGKGTSAPVELEDDEFTDAVTERLELVYDALDDALTASALDAAGAKKGGRITTRPGQEGPGRAAQPVSGALAPSPTSHGRWTPDGTGPKSQLAFEDGVDNANARVMPKYDGLSAVPTFDGGGQAAAAAAALAADQQPPHPLQAVLSTLRYQPWQTEAAPPQLPLGFDTTPYTFVDTPQGLREMGELVGWLKVGLASFVCTY